MIYAGILALALITFFFLPQIDLETSRLFYVSGRGFVLADWPPVVFLYLMVPWITWSILALVATAAIWLFLVGRPIWRLDRKALTFLVASTALGPGLLVNTILKEHRGRARPTQIEAFGGSRQFTPAPLPAAECSSNCAFVSGHAALGFSLIAFAFLLPPPGGLRRGAVATVLVIGAVIGLAQGAHFLSMFSSPGCSFTARRHCSTGGSSSAMVSRRRPSFTFVEGWGVAPQQGGPWGASPSGHRRFVWCSPRPPC